MSAHEFLCQYGTEEQCETALFASKWPQDWKCLRCGGARYSGAHNRCRLWECLDCGYQSFSIVGNVFENTKLLLTIWFLTICLMTQGKNAISALAVSDGLWCFEAVTPTVAQHGRDVVGSGKLAVQHPSFAGSTRCLEIAKLHSAEHSTHSHSRKVHTPYLAELSYRCYRRFDLAIMVPRLLHTAVTTNQLPLSILRIFEKSN